jgi:hypothetical protein
MSPKAGYANLVRSSMPRLSSKGRMKQYNERYDTDFVDPN